MEQWGNQDGRKEVGELSISLSINTLFLKGHPGSLLTQTAKVVIHKVYKEEKILLRILLGTLSLFYNSKCWLRRVYLGNRNIR